MLILSCEVFSVIHSSVHSVSTYMGDSKCVTRPEGFSSVL